MDMHYVKFIIIPLLIIGVVLGAYFALSSEYALVVQYKGLMAHQQWDVFKIVVYCMICITLPTIIIMLIVAWRYRAENKRAKYEPERTSGLLGQIILWTLPSIVVIVMATINWEKTHELDPHQPLKGDGDPLKIQVIALNWKWLFIYPEQGIAMVNFFQFPEKIPINFELTADNAPINSFWLPQLSGQIYAMSGMITPLHILAYETGEFPGRAAEINGEGLADMTFVAKASTQQEFDTWVKNVKKSALKLDSKTYEELTQFSTNYPVTLYADVEKDLFKKVVMKYHTPAK